jgi:hypothetical protein
MSQPTNIFRIPGIFVAPGKCGVCSATTSIRWHDAVTGVKLGNCCVDAVVAADRCLSRASAGGLRHPTMLDRQNPAFHR